jgi:hypothetical protein
MEIHTYANCALFLVDRHRIGHPLGQMDRIDKTSFEKFLDFNLNGYFFPGINRMKLLSNWLGIKISCDFMFDYFWINAWHFPRKTSQKRHEII